MQKEAYDANISVNAERGYWRYTIENRADSEHGPHLLVLPLPSSEKRVWTSIDVK